MQVAAWIPIVKNIMAFASPGATESSILSGTCHTSIYRFAESQQNNSIYGHPSGITALKFAAWPFAIGLKHWAMLTQKPNCPTEPNGRVATRQS